jgi:hypothetical protein
MASSVLTGPDPSNPDDLVDVVGGAAATNWQAASWLLLHHPAHREQFGDLARDRRIRRDFLARVIAAIAAAELHPDDERRVLLQMQAHGVGSAE